MQQQIKKRPFAKTILIFAKGMQNYILFLFIQIIVSNKLVKIQTHRFYLWQNFYYFSKIIITS